jgi:hypothetical protein
LANKNENFFAIFVRDRDPAHRWIAVIGRRRGIEAVHLWCRTHLEQDDRKWFTILHTDDDTVILEVLFFDDFVYNAFQTNFKDQFLPEDYDDRIKELTQPERPKPDDDDEGYIVWD